MYHTLKQFLFLSMKKLINEEFIEAREVIDSSINNLISDIETLSRKIISSIENGQKILIMGNGGSASDAQHFSAELLGKYHKVRKPLPAISLNSDTSTLTCIANDFGFEYLFSRQIEALAVDNDIVIGISTSGKSENILNGLIKAKKMNCFTVLLTGERNLTNNDFMDLVLKAKSKNTARIQEVHGLIIRILCKLIDEDISLRDT